MGTRFIAEVGINHNGSLDRCLKLIGMAKSFGFWAVKFQYYKAEMLWHDDERREAARPGELPISFFPTLRAKADELGIKLGCSVYHKSHVEQISKYVDFLKISSFEANNEDLFLECYSTGLPLFISHGVASEWNIPISNVYQLHCVSRYPTLPEQCNLRMLTMFDGWSDHSRNLGVALSAIIRYNVEYLELHIDLEDGKGRESKLGHCWFPSHIASLMTIVSDVFEADGTDDLSQADQEREDLKRLQWKEEFDAR